MTRMRDEPGRRCKPVDEWPSLARERWLAALKPDDLAENGECRAELSFYWNHEIEKSYGRWLTWCENNGVPLSQVAPCQQITPERVRAFVNCLLKMNASRTVLNRLIGLKVIGTIIQPGQNWFWIYRIASKIRAQRKPAKSKRERLVSIEQLQILGFHLMEMAENETNELRGFKLHRDGLTIGLLAARPTLRLRNLAGLNLGRTLIRQGRRWWIEIPEGETKNNDPIEAPWPDELLPHLEKHLAVYRPAIIRLRTSSVPLISGGLWLSVGRAQPLSKHTLYFTVVARTRERFGHPINPHLFRDCANTSIAIDDPENIGIIPRLLAHRGQSTSERYYNQARSVEASRAMQKFLLSLRHGTAQR